MLTPAGTGYKLTHTRGTWVDLLAEIATKPKADRGPLLDELDAREHEAGEEMFGQESVTNFPSDSFPAPCYASKPKRTLT